MHVGRFYDRYFSPMDISCLMKECGVDYYVVSSTTQCEEDYPGVIREIKELIRIDKTKVLPAIWITPRGLQGDIEWYLETKIKWRMIKVHPEINPTEWLPESNNFLEVVEIASEMHLPILIHTAEKVFCEARTFESLIAKYPNITFILAHGRPSKQALSILRIYENAFADSAFMSVQQMQRFIEKGLSHKLIWGTDMCIPKHFYPNKDMAEYYRGKVNAFQKVCTQNQFEQVMFRNASKIFNLKL